MKRKNANKEKRMKCNHGRNGSGLMYAGTIVFVIGLAIILFKELNIPRYWSTAVIGLMLIAAGYIARSLKQVCGRKETLDQEKRN